MPSVSRKQQRLMGQALAYKRGEIKSKDLNPQYADEIKKLAKSMTEKQLKDFASTKHKNLPEKVKESNVMTFDSFNKNEIYAYGSDEQAKSADIFKKLGIDNFTVGNDHLGNDNVFLFTHKGYKFEIYTIPSDAYHVNYGKIGDDNEWIENFNTMDLEKSLREILDNVNEAHKQINHKDQKLSKDMKKQSHVSSKKPSNKKLSSEDHLAEKPKKGSYREPNSKKIDGEKFLAQDQKLTHVKEFKRFINESSNEQEEVLKWWNSLDITLQIHLANEYSVNFDIIETIPYDEILNIYRNEMNLTESESNDISLNSNGNLFIVSSYSGSGIPEHFNMIGDEKTTLKEYLEIVSSMKGSNYDETFVVVLAEIIRYPISFYYTRGIEIRNAKPLRVSYDVDNHNVRHYNVPENLKNDFLEKD